MRKLDIVDGVSPNGNHYFEVVENDDRKYPSLGIFKTREKAEMRIEELSQPCGICGDHDCMGGLPCQTGDGI